MSRDNAAYILLIIVAIILVVITVRLQGTIIASQQQTGSDQTSLIRNFRQRLANLILPETPTPTPAPPTAILPTPLPTATPTPEVAVPTSTPFVIVLEPTATPVSVASALSTPVPVVPIPTTTDMSAPMDFFELSEQIAAILGLENMLTTSDEQLLASIVEVNPNSIGFLGQAQYQKVDRAIRAIGIQLPDGRVIEPDAATIADGTYPLASSLYVYTTAKIIEQIPEVRAFLGCYLNQVNTHVSTVGLSPANQNAYQDALRNYNTAVGNLDLYAVPDCVVPAAASTRTISIAGTPLLTPLTSSIAESFRSSGYGGDIITQSVGTSSGFNSFCGVGNLDLITAIRPIQDGEMAVCLTNNRVPLAFPIASQILQVIVSEQNRFVDQLSVNQLRFVFSEATLWSQLNSAWPEEAIHRAAPDSRGPEFGAFINVVFNTQSVAIQSRALADASPRPLLSTDTPAEPETLADTTGSTENTQATTPSVDYVFGIVEDRPECVLSTEIVTSLLDEWGWKVETVSTSTMHELFDLIATQNEQGISSVDLTLCYTDPLDRELFFQFDSDSIQLMGNGYWQNNNQRMYVMARAGIPAALEFGDRCIWEMMKDLKFGTEPMADMNAAQWMAENEEVLKFWGSCQGHYRHSFHDHNLFK